ncbi:helix-turn-helix transcriptional regulator [Roseovarius sp.]|uniref:helix-turn-helix transcriptional regulator n=1 Tax=Roseovarius sp. TaxID=1486281 RepID=UPI003D13C389
MTQAALADAIGVSRGFVSEIASGKKEPSLTTLRKIAETLGVPLSEIYTDDTDQRGFAEQATRFEPRSDSEVAMLDLFRGMGKRVELYEVNSPAPLLYLNKGDRIAVDIGEIAQPGDTVIASEIDDSGTGHSFVARWLDPWIEPGDTSRRPERMDDSGRLAVMGVVKGAIRL